MFFGFGSGDSRRPAEQDHRDDAARVLRERMAEGRPPPEVWTEAEQRWARQGRAAGWYAPAGGAAASVASAGPRARLRVSDPVRDPLALRVVRLPLGAPAPSGPPMDLRARPVHTAN